MTSNSTFLALLILSQCSSQQPVPRFTHLYGGAELQGELAAQTGDGRVFSCSSASNPAPSARCLDEVPSLSGATSITELPYDATVGKRQYCAALSDGTVKCAHCVTFGHSCDDWVSPIPGLVGVVAVHQACAVVRDGSIACWDPASTIASSAPAPVSAIGCAYLLLQDGALYDPNVATTVLADVRTLSCGLGAADITNCAVTNATDLYCWGSNMQGRLGDGTVESQTAPEFISTGFVDVAVALPSDYASATCGLKVDGSIWCWGRGGAASIDMKPVAIVGLSNVTQLITAQPAVILGDGTTENSGFYVLRSDGIVSQVGPPNPVQLSDIN